MALRSRFAPSLMTRPRFDTAACETLAGCIQEIERSTDAELVVVVRARSTSYAHADYLFGFTVAFIVLLVILFVPFSFPEYFVPIDVAVAFVIGSIISWRSNSIRRLFSTEKFRRNAVRTAAAAMFYEAGIANTNAEMGVLIYLSLMERQLELIADRGVLKKVPAHDWNHEIFDLHKQGENPDPKGFQDAIQRFGKVLAAHVPATGENPNELPDMPRFELK
jgi:putative membrane protein